MSNNYRRNRYYEERSNEEKTETPVVEEKMEPETRKGVVVGAPMVNVRKQADSATTVVTVARDGDELTILGEKDNYYKVLTSDHYKGYILKKYCREV